MYIDSEVEHYLRELSANLITIRQISIGNNFSICGDRALMPLNLCVFNKAPARGTTLAAGAFFSSLLRRHCSRVWAQAPHSAAQWRSLRVFILNQPDHTYQTKLSYCFECLPSKGENWKKLSYPRTGTREICPTTALEEHTPRAKATECLTDTQHRQSLEETIIGFENMLEGSYPMYEQIPVQTQRDEHAAPQIQFDQA